jgi:VWFA-related protein
MKHVLAFVFLICSFTVAAQEVRQSHQDYLLSVDVALVQLPVSVLDKNGAPVHGLRKEHFQVFEDNSIQEISLFRQEDVPASVGLVIDNSGSMVNKQNRVIDAALSFVRGSNPEDETFIVRFDDTAYLEQDYTDNVGDLMKVLHSRESRGKTALYDAIYLSAEYLDDSRNDKHALLLISDGEDNASKYRLNEVLQQLQRSKAAVYVIGLLDERGGRGRFFRRSLAKKAKEVLTEFAEISGGRAYFPKNVKEMGAIGREIARDLRSHYTIGYTPSNRNLDGSWRNVRVRLNPPKNLPKVTLRTKQGYYAPRSAALRER